MAESRKVGMRMASATKEDIKSLYTLKHILDAMCEQIPESVDDFEWMDLDEKEKTFLSQIFEDGEVSVERLVSYLRGLTNGFHRVVMGYQVLYDNTANPDLDYLDFNKSIQEMILVWNHLWEHLKEGREVCITPDSTIGQMILLSESENEKEVSNG